MSEPTWFAAERLQSKGLMVYLPRAAYWAKLGRRRAFIERPAFPGYLFLTFPAAGIEMLEPRFDKARLVRAGQTPLKIPACMIAELKEHEAAGAFCRKPEQRFAPGDRVTFKSGSFEGHGGIVETLKGASHAIVLVEILARYVKVDASLAALVKAEARRG